MEAIKQAIKLKKETKLKCVLGVSDAPGNIGRCNAVAKL